MTSLEKIDNNNVSSNNMSSNNNNNSSNNNINNNDGSRPSQNMSSGTHIDEKAATKEFMGDIINNATDKVLDE